MNRKEKDEWINNWIQASFYLNKAEYCVLGMLNNRDNKELYADLKKQWKFNIQQALRLMKEL